VDGDEAEPRVIVDGMVVIEDGSGIGAHFFVLVQSHGE